MNGLTVVSYNIKGLGNPVKRKKILNQLKTLNTSIAMLQETHLSEAEHLKLKRDWVEHIYSASHEGGRKRGVAILIRKNVFFNTEKVVKDKEGRYIMVKGTIGENRFTFLNLYAPNEDCPLFFKKIASKLADEGEGIIVVGGDYNCVLNSNIDRLPADKGPRTRKSVTLLGMMDGLGLIDVWRYQHPRDRDYTYRSQVHGSYSRLDMFLISKVDIHKVTECRIEPITLSDHSPIKIKINLDQEKQFRYWRLNVSILNDPIIQQELRNKLKEYMEINDNGEANLSLLWDTAKAVMRGHIIQITSRIKKQREARRLELETLIGRLEKEHKKSRDRNTLELLKQERQKLDELLTYKAEGMLRFVKRKYYEMGNKASRLLAFQLRKAQSNRVVSKIKHPDTNVITSNPKEIAEAFAAYYKKLYECQELAGKTEKITKFLDSIHLNSLSKMEAEVMCSPITVKEIIGIIKNLKNSKSPGADGFSGEYYKVFVDELAPILCRVYNYALNEKNPPKTWSEAIISVIHKDGKDPTQCMGYRPISLLCQDLKILTSILANRIQIHICKLVNPDQTGFITGRQGTNNVRRALNLQSIASDRDTPSMLLSLDAEKAFDRLDWIFLKETLAHMGFNETFLSWLDVFYTNPKSRVRVNGHCSKFFDLGRGTRQGDALSPALFALSIEPLAELIRSNHLIQGIRDEGGDQHKIALYADDVLLFIENPVDSIPALLQNLDEYGLLSGYKVNPSKSEAIMVSGAWPSQLDDVVTFRRSQQGFRYLGAILTPKITQLYQANYKKIFETFKNDLARWDVLPLSLFGRVETVKMNILPRLLFLFQSLPVWIPSSAFNMLDKLISKFIWQNKKPRVRLKLLTLEKNKGGLALPNIKYYYWAAQLTALVVWINNNIESGWVKIEQNSLPSIPLSVLVFLNKQSQEKLEIKNVWVKHTLKVWSTVQKRFRGRAALSRVMQIVGNPNFPPSRTDITFKRWADRKLKIIDQLFCDNVLQPFSYLQDKFSLPQSDMFRYFQIRHYLTNHKDWDLIQNAPTNVEMHFINIIKHQLPNKKHVSHIYKNLLLDTQDNTLHIKNKWELELNVTIEDEEWEAMCLGCHKGINSPMWKEFDWKTKLRYFKMPSVVAKFIENPAAIYCWRKCGMVGDHAHIFWDCPKMLPYWKEIKREIDTILAIDLPFTPSQFLLDLIPEGMYNNKKQLLHILLITARKMVTLNWMNPLPPKVTQWKLKLKEVYGMEALTAKVQLRVEDFRESWQPIARYLSEEKH